jgi:hypothetical protein
VSAAEALPFPSEEPNPWRDTSTLQHIPTPADLAAAPPFDPASRAAHERALPELLTQRAWRPANAEEDDFLDALYQARVDEVFIERAEVVRDWPDNEPERWS